MDFQNIYPYQVQSFDGESLFEVGKLRALSAYYGLALFEINGEHPDYISIDAPPPTSFTGLHALGFSGEAFTEVAALEEYTYENHINDSTPAYREDLFAFTIDNEHPSAKYIRRGNFIVDKLGRVVGMVIDIIDNYIPEIGATSIAEVVSPFWIKKFLDLDESVALDCRRFTSNTECLAEEWKRVNEAIYNRENHIATP